MLELLRTFICNKRVLLIHHFVVPLSRCGSVTLGLLREPPRLCKFASENPYPAPLRYPLWKAKNERICFFAIRFFVIATRSTPFLLTK